MDNINDNYLFIHIPKTAGRSIQKFLTNFPKHEHFSVYEQINKIGEQEFLNKFKFTIVRNPWERMVSVWRFFGYNLGHDKILNDLNDFNRWLNNHIKQSKNRKPYQKTPCQQFSYLKNEKGEILIDYFIHFENLNQDFIELTQILKIDKPDNLKNIGKEEKFLMHHPNSKNQNQELVKKLAQNYKIAYENKENIEIVAELEKEVIGKFGYKF